MHPILVTGASGKTGNAVARQLLETGHTVRAVVHRRDDRSDALKLRSAPTSSSPISSTSTAYARQWKGTKRAYFTLPFHPHALQIGAAFAVAANEARLEAIVGMTQWLASPTHPAQRTRVRAGLLTGFSRNGAGSRARCRKPRLFRGQLPRADRSARGGASWYLSVSVRRQQERATVERGHRTCRRRMSARSAKRTPATPIGRRVPEIVGGREIAAALTRVFERPVRAIDLPWWLFAKALRVSGFDRNFQMNLRQYVADHKTGAFSFAAPSGDVEQAHGSARPRVSRRSHTGMATVPSLRPTIGNRLKTLAEFAAAADDPGIRPRTLCTRRMQFVAARHPELAMENRRWIAQRSVPRSLLANAISEHAPMIEADAA